MIKHIYLIIKLLIAMQQIKKPEYFYSGFKNFLIEI